MKGTTIAYICGSSSWGGLEMNQLRNAVWMQKRGNSVVLFCRLDSPLYHAAHEEGILTVTIRPHRKYYDVRCAFELRKKIKANQVTHLFVRDPKDMSLCALTKTLLGGKLTLVYFMEMQLGIDKKDPLHTLRFKQFDFWSCPLPWLAEQVKTRTNYPADRVLTIPSGLDLSPFEQLPSRETAQSTLQLPKELILFGLIGRFDVQKGQLTLLEALSKLPTESKIGVLLLGEKTKDEADDYYASLLTFIETNQLQDKVFIRPFRKDINTFYAAIDVLVMASASETFGMVTIEALAAGKSVIGTNTGGTPEILQHGQLGRLFTPFDANELAEQMRLHLKSPLIPTDKLKEAAKKYDATWVCKEIEENFHAG